MYVVGAPTFHHTHIYTHAPPQGIEVARRDNCPLVVKVQEKALRVLFETRDLSQVSSIWKGRPAPPIQISIMCAPAHKTHSVQSNQNQVKAYVVRQLQKIHAGGVRVQDFIFATEVRPCCGCVGLCWCLVVFGCVWMICVWSKRGCAGLFWRF